MLWLFTLTGRAKVELLCFEACGSVSTQTQLSERNFEAIWA